MNRKLFLESLCTIGIPFEKARRICMLAESIYSDGPDSLYDMPNDLSEYGYSNYITRPRNVLNLPAEGNYTIYINDVIKPLTRAIVGEYNVDDPTFNTNDDEGIIETAAFFINTFNNAGYNHSISKGDRDRLIEAIYKYPLTRMAQKMDSYEGTGSVYVGISSNDVLVFSFDVYLIAFPHIKGLCDEIDRHTVKLKAAIDQSEMAVKLKNFEKKNVNANTSVNNNLQSKLDKLDSSIDNISDDSGIREFYTNISEYAKLCDSTRDIEDILSLLASTDEMFIDEADWPVDDEDRMNAMNAMANKWKALGGNISIDNDNKVVYMGRDDIYEVPIEHDDIAMFAARNGIEMSDDLTHDVTTSDDASDEDDDGIPKQFWDTTEFSQPQDGEQDNGNQKTFHEKPKFQNNIQFNKQKEQEVSKDEQRKNAVKQLNNMQQQAQIRAQQNQGEPQHEIGKYRKNFHNGQNGEYRHNHEAFGTSMQKKVDANKLLKSFMKGKWK